MKRYIFSFILILLISLITISPVQAQNRYQVQRGDSLWQISQNFGLSVQEIIDLNNIQDINNLYIGQELILSEENDTHYESYTVQEGDSLWTISQKHDVSIQELIDVNDNLDSNQTIYIGQTLNIHGTEPDDTEDSNTTDNQYIHHEVEEGDILWNISQTYDVSVQELAEINNIRDGYDIYPGRTLIIPVTQEEQDQENKEQPTEEPVEADSESYVPYYFYYIQEGEQIWNIANKFGLRVSEIVDFNNITNIRDIEKEELLIIPINESNNYNYIRENNRKLNNHYRVQSDETLSEIAEFFEIPEEGLRAINNLNKEEDVYTGQNLLMPVSPAFFTEHEIYTVTAEEGEYLFDIAYNKGVSIRPILKANYLKNPNTQFEEGTTIIVPVDEASQTTWIDFEDGKPQNSLFFRN